MKTVIRWIFGIFFLLGTLSFLILKAFAVSFLWFLLTVLVIPLFDKKLKLQGKVKIIIGVIIFFTSIAIFTQSGEYKRIEEKRKYDEAHPSPTIMLTSTPTPIKKIEPTVVKKTPTVETVKPTNTPIPTKKPSPTKPDEETQPPTHSTTIDEFPTKFEDYLNNTWDEMPGTSYKVYWWDTWEGVDSGNVHLVVEPDFVPTDWQCNRIAQVTAIGRFNLLGIKDGVIHVVKWDNSGDYCTLRTP